MKKVLVPGTFDPITLGHLDVIGRASNFFDEVVVGVAYSPKKNGGTFFTLEQRVELAKESTKDMENVSVLPFKSLLIDFARELGACAVVKGLRSNMDFEMEIQMATLNKKFDPSIESLFMMSSSEQRSVSSSMVRELASFGVDVSDLVTPCVHEALKRKLEN